MSAFYRIARCTAAATLALLLCLASVTTASSTVAGWVDVQAEVAPYVVLRVVDDSTGVVVRSAPLDSTHTFSFTGIMPAAVSVEAVAQLPDHLFELDAAASVLKASAATGLQLKVAATPKATAAGAAAKAAGQSAGSSLGSAALALTALLAAWYGRHRIVSALDMPSFKPPKPRKMMVAM